MTYYTIFVGSSIEKYRVACIARLNSLVQFEKVVTLDNTHVIISDIEILPGVKSVPIQDIEKDIESTRFRSLWEKCKVTSGLDYFGNSFQKVCMANFLRLYLCWKDPTAFYADSDIWFNWLPAQGYFTEKKPYFAQHKGTMLDYNLIYCNGRTDYFPAMLDDCGKGEDGAIAFRAGHDFLMEQGYQKGNGLVGMIDHRFFKHKFSAFR